MRHWQKLNNNGIETTIRPSAGFKSKHVSSANGSSS